MKKLLLVMGLFALCSNAVVKAQTQEQQCEGSESGIGTCSEQEWAIYHQQQNEKAINREKQQEKSCPKFTIVPAISNVEYMKARGTLIASGWKPLRFLLSVKSDTATYARVNNLIDNGVFEVQKCDSNVNQCAFGFRDKYGNLLEVLAKDDFNNVVLRTEIVCITEHQEWDERAAKITKAFVALNSNNIAQQIQRTTHPSGSAPVLVGLSVAKYDDRVSAEMVVEWHGGFSNATYKTTVAWDFNKNSYGTTTIKADSAMVAAAPANLALLNKFFENDLYPLVRAALED